jgi:hypothetical protein
MPRCSATAGWTPWSTTPAGRTATARLLEVSEDEFDRCYAVNMKSIYLATIHAVPALPRRGRQLHQHRLHRRRAPAPGADLVQRLQGRRHHHQQVAGGRAGAGQHPRELHQPGVQPRHRPEPPSFAGGPVDEARMSQVPAPPSRWGVFPPPWTWPTPPVPGQRRGGLHQWRLHRGGRGALRLTRPSAGLWRLAYSVNRALALIASLAAGLLASAVSAPGLTATRSAPSSVARRSTCAGSTRRRCCWSTPPAPAATRPSTRAWRSSTSATRAPCPNV